MVIGFILLLVAGVVCLILSNKKNAYDLDWYGGWALAFFIIGIALTFVFWPIIYVDSYVQLTKMEAFYDSNRAVYETTIETTRNAIYQISKDPGLRVDVENLKQSTNWSERLAEFRDAVIEYNTCIYKLRRYNNTFVLSALFANPREDLKLIVLKE